MNQITTVFISVLALTVTTYTLMSQPSAGQADQPVNACFDTVKAQRIVLVDEEMNQQGSFECMDGKASLQLGSLGDASEIRLSVDEYGAAMISLVGSSSANTMHFRVSRDYSQIYMLSREAECGLSATIGPDESSVVMTHAEDGMLALETDDYCSRFSMWNPSKNNAVGISVDNFGTTAHTRRFGEFSLIHVDELAEDL